MEGKFFSAFSRLTIRKSGRSQNPSLQLVASFSRWTCP